MFGFFALLLMAAVNITIVTGMVCHWPPILLAILVGCLMGQSIDEDE